MLQGQQLLQTERAETLGQKRSDRDAARQFAATEYLSQIQAERDSKRELENYRQKLAIDQSLGIGNFAPRGKKNGGDPTQKVLTFGGQDILFQDGVEVGRADTYNPATEIAKIEAEADAQLQQGFLNGGQLDQPDESSGFSLKNLINRFIQ